MPLFESYINPPNFRIFYLQNIQNNLYKILGAVNKYLICSYLIITIHVQLYYHMTIDENNFIHHRLSEWCNGHMPKRTACRLNVPSPIVYNNII